ncbi:hypothetical protein HPP92_025084 [Vanilla planifolia]|uniref:Uncharacterized protein n=1 Tax=Vanilla planifolia TaxID=51239 RepID=A0A835PJY4_VANPL|nr:hypothetical protein HPP92_025354 [Vanilla planifolia]KAG0453780.1 hypothetical protein HPP92_025084 [Vanilla planifolia]
MRWEVDEQTVARLNPTVPSPTLRRSLIPSPQWLLQEVAGVARRGMGRLGQGRSRQQLDVMSGTIGVSEVNN